MANSHTHTQVIIKYKEFILFYSRANTEIHASKPHTPTGKPPAIRHQENQPECFKRILEPSLFKVFINDLDTRLEGIPSKFADDVKLGGAVEGRGLVERP